MVKIEKYKIEAANEYEKEEIQALYDIQKGKEFCPWTDEYPTVSEIEFDLERNALFVMKNADNKIIAAISIDEDEAVKSLDFWNKELSPGGEVARLAVLPEYQGQKIAARMIEYVMQVLKERGYKSIHFMVNKYNTKALNAYRNLNFNNVGEIFIYDQHMMCYEKEL